MKKSTVHILFHVSIIIGTIIGVSIFGNREAYVKTMVGMMFGYWCGYFYWNHAFKQPKQ